MRVLEELDKNSLVMDDGLPLPSATLFMAINKAKIKLEPNPDMDEAAAQADVNPFWTLVCHRIAMLNLKRMRRDVVKLVIEDVQLPPPSEAGRQGADAASEPSTACSSPTSVANTSMESKPARVALRKEYEFPFPEVSLAYYEAMATRAYQRATLKAWEEREARRNALAEESAAALNDSALTLLNQFSSSAPSGLSAVQQRALMWARSASYDDLKAAVPTIISRSASSTSPLPGLFL